MQQNHPWSVNFHPQKLSVVATTPVSWQVICQFQNLTMCLFVCDHLFTVSFYCFPIDLLRLGRLCFIDIFFALFYMCLDEIKLFLYNKRKLPLHQSEKKKVLYGNSFFSLDCSKGRTYQKWLQYSSNHKKAG